MTRKAAFIVFSGLLTALTLPAASPVKVEKRQAGQGSWITKNSYRIAVTSASARDVPILFEGELPPLLNEDSIRVVDQTNNRILPAKSEWTTPSIRIGWLSTGSRAYFIYFDTGSDGEIVRLTEPAMVGCGDRVSYGRAGVHGKLAVGLHASPAAIDFDQDGKIDLIVSSRRHKMPYNGVWLFHNIGTNAKPLFDRPRWLGPGQKSIVVADMNGDGAPDLIVGEPDLVVGPNLDIKSGYFDDIRRNEMSRFVPFRLEQPYKADRENLRYPVDWDGDGKIDLIVGVGDWTDYGWDRAFNEKGEWTRGPIHGYVYFHRNIGTNQQPVYAPPVQLQAGGKKLDLRGSPMPNPVDWFGRGRLDLIGGDFFDTITLFENIGTRTKPVLAAGRLLNSIDGKQIQMDLCMLEPRVADWHGDGRPSLVVGQEDGTVSLIENVAARGQEPKLKPPRYLEQVAPYVKAGVLSRPASVDWNGDGKLDIISGDSSGRIHYFENVGTVGNASFEDRGYLKAGGETIRIMAGPNGSVQGPVEQKWGYTQPSVADWDLDGKLDIVVNSIWGKVIWYRNMGSKSHPDLAASAPVEVEWPGLAPKPAWNWWTPRGKELVTQWRTTPKVIDWNADGLPDLVMLDTEGYLAFYERYWEGKALKLKAPRRIFIDEHGQPLRIKRGEAGRSGRRNFDVADWDGDGDMDIVIDMEGEGHTAQTAAEYFDYTIAWYENVGSQKSPKFLYRGRLTDRRLVGHNSSPNVADWNGDGKPDIIVGAEDGLFYFFDHNYIKAKSGH